VTGDAKNAERVGPRAHRRAVAARSVAGFAALAIAAGGPLGGVSGCAARPRVPDFTDPQTTAPTLNEVRSRLAALAADDDRSVADPEARASLTRAGRAIPVPDPPAATELAQQPLDAALDAVIGDRDTSAPDNPDEGAFDDGASPVASIDRTAALEAYAGGREALIRDDADTAIDLLERATEIDPSSPEAWRALAEAQLALGLQASAMVSLERAIELGLDEPRALTLAGVDALGRRQTERAASLLARAERSPLPDADEGLPPIRRAALGEALINLGRLEAGAELITRAIAVRPAFSTPTRVARELGTLFRRRPELWLAAGDALAAVGRTADADDAYAAAIGLPGADRSAIAARRLALALTDARPAQAARLLVDRLADAGGIAGTRDVRLIAAVCAAAPDRRIAAALRDAIAALGHAQGDATPTQRLALVRAHAATLQPPPRRAVLLEALALDDFRSPTAAAALSGDLLRTVGRDDAERLARITRDAMAAAPDHARQIALDAVEIAADPAAVVEQLIDGGSPLARDATLLSLGRLEEVSGEPARDPALTAVRAEAAALAGRWETADALRSQLNNAPPDLLLTALVAAQRTDEAAELAERTIASDAVPNHRLLAASDALRFARRFEPAARAAERAVANDPYDEAAHERVLALRGGATPAADAEAADAAARALRDTRPDGRLLRLLTAGELVRRRLLDEADRRIGELAAEDPLDAAVLDRQIDLARAIVRANRSPDAIEADLRAAHERHPGSALVARALAIVLATDGRPAEATRVAERTIAASGTRALDRLLEQALTEAGETERAERLRAERLRARPLSIDASIELADLAASGAADGIVDHPDPGSPASVLAMLRTGVPARATLTEAQELAVSAVLVRTVAGIGQDAASFGGGGVTAALDLLDWAERREVSLSSGMHGRRLALLERVDASIGRITSAVRAAVREHPGSSAEFIGAQLVTLRADGRTIEAATMVSELLFEPDPVVPDPLRPALIREMLNLSAGALDPDGVRSLIDDLDRRGVVGEVLGVLNAAPGDDRFARGPAALAYTIAALGSIGLEDEVVEPLYRLALAYDPGHVWAANDLGYQLLERGVKPEDAERLIVIAATGAPDRYNIVDSLGWLRYHQGRLESPEDADPDDDSDIARLGAIDLLRRAVELLEADPDRNDDGIIADHLGDALARAGRLDEARVAWNAATTRATGRVREMALSQQTDSPAYRRVAELLRSLQIKVRAVENGDPPPLPEPRFAPPPPPPPPDPFAGE